MGFDAFDYSSQGGREYNEDSVGYKIAGNSGIFVVADGLGGHQYGELASSCICDVLVNSWNGEFMQDTAVWLQNQIALSNQNILKLQQEKNAVLKSTVVALAVDHGKAVWANVGDSRLYYLHNDELMSFTNDHSVAYKKYKGGEISRDQIRTDEDQSALLRSVGSPDRNEPELYQPVSLQPGDAFMLCSDGLWEHITDGEVLIDFLKAETAKEWAENLLLRAIERVNGKHDNLSVLTVIVTP